MTTTATALNLEQSIMYIVFWIIARGECHSQRVYSIDGARELVNRINECGYKVFIGWKD